MKDEMDKEIEDMYNKMKEKGADDDEDRYFVIRSIILVSLLIVVAVGLPFIFCIGSMITRKNSIENTRNVNIVLTDKKDAECFSSDIQTGSSTVVTKPGDEFRVYALFNVYCKDGTESFNVKNKYKINTELFIDDKNNQILYYKEFKDNGNMIYFNLREKK